MNKSRHHRIFSFNNEPISRDNFLRLRRDRTQRAQTTLTSPVAKRQLNKNFLTVDEYQRPSKRKVEPSFDSMCLEELANHVELYRSRDLTQQSQSIMNSRHNTSVRRSINIDGIHQTTNTDNPSTDELDQHHNVDQEFAYEQRFQLLKAQNQKNDINFQLIKAQKHGVLNQRRKMNSPKSDDQDIEAGQITPKVIMSRKPHDHLKMNKKIKSQLSNPFDDDHMLQDLKKGIDAKVSKKLQQHLEEGVKFVKDKNASKMGKFRQSDSLSTVSVKKKWLENPNRPAHIEFFEYFEIVEMVTYKMLIARCKKLNGQLFLLKMLTNSVAFSEKDAKSELRRKRLRMNLDASLDFNEAVESWVNTVPQNILQSLMPCYGVIRIKDHYYTVTDLVEDYKHIPFQKADFSSEYLSEPNLNPEPQHTEDHSKDDDSHVMTSRNVYEYISFINFGNMQTIPNIPDQYTNFVIRYIVYISRAFSHAHRNDLVHGKFNLSKVMLQRPKESEKEEHRHCHDKKLGKDENSISSSDPDTCSESGEEIAFFNYFVSNFEPWTVNQLKKKFDNDPRFKQLLICLKNEKIDDEWAGYLNVVKILDLWSFGNSILDLLCGKCHEDIEMQEDIEKRANQVLDVFNIQENGKKLQGRQMAPKSGNVSEQALGISKSQKPYTGGVSLDSVPLEWGKKQFIGQLIQIINLCLGPKAHNNNFGQVQTHEIFTQISKISLEIYKEHHLYNYTNSIDPLLKLDVLAIDEIRTNNQRLKSSVLNNQASLLNLSLSVSTSKQLRLKTFQRIMYIYDQAIRCSGSNVVVNVNRALLEWQLGLKSDEEFILFLVTDISPRDDIAAKLLFFIFTQEITCNEVDIQEIFDTIEMVHEDINKVSNLARFLFDLPIIKEYRRQHFEQQNLEIINKQSSITKMTKNKNFQNVYDHMVKPMENKIIKIKTSDDDSVRFKPEGIFISNNENYVAVVGKSETWVIDTIKGKIEYSQPMPIIKEQEFRDKKFKSKVLGTNNADDSMSEVPSNSQITKIGSQLYRDSQTHVQEDDNDSQLNPMEFAQEKSQQRSKTKMDQSIDTSQSRNEGATQMRFLSQPEISLDLAVEGGHDEKIDKDKVHPANIQSFQSTRAHTVLNSHNISQEFDFTINTSNPNVQTSFKPTTMLGMIQETIEIKKDIEQELVEQRILFKKHPPVWSCDVSNNGKLLAFYDKGQIVRYKNAKNIRGNQEELHVFNVFSKKAEQTKHYILDMKFLLNSNEVLSFSFDNEEDLCSQHCIHVQARDLFIYQIDYLQESILRKFDSRPTNIIMRSIFYEESDYNSRKGQEVKEYIQEQQSLGNQVIMPKFNNSYILVREKTSNLIQIHSIYLQKIVRKFILTTEELEFDQEYLEQFIEHNSKPLQQKHKCSREIESMSLNPKFYKRDVRKLLYKPPDFHESFEPGQTYNDYHHFKCTKTQKNKQNKSLQLGLKKQSEIKSQHEWCIEQDKMREIKVLEFSPHGNLVVAHIGDNIFIKVLNMQDEDQMERSVTIADKPLMPFYFDFDYNQMIQPFVKPQRLSKVNNTQLTIPELDRIVLVIRLLEDFHGSQYLKNNKLIEANNFLRKLFRNPKSLFMVQIKKKQREEYIQLCFYLIKAYLGFDSQQIRIQNLVACSKFFQFTSIHYERIGDYVKSFTCSSSVEKNYMVILLRRKLQCYCYLTGKLQFEIRIADAGAYIINQGMPQPTAQQNIFLMDNDQIIVIQKSPTCLQFINIALEIETFGRKNVQKVEREITFMIDKPLGKDIDIDSGFGALDTGYGKGLTFGGKDNASDDDDEDTGVVKCQKAFLEYGFKIEGIYTCRATDEYSYLGIIAKDQFSIYYVQEDPSDVGVDIQQSLKVNYKFDHFLRSMGQVINIDFEKDCINFLAGTKLGWIQIWDLQNKMLKRRFKIVNSITKLPEPINYIKLKREKRTILAFNQNTNELSVTRYHVELPPKLEDEESEDITPIINFPSRAALRNPQDSTLKVPLKLAGKDRKITISQKAKPTLVKKFVLYNEPDLDFVSTHCHKWILSKEYGRLDQFQSDRDDRFLFVVYQRAVQVYDISQETNIRLIQTFGPYETEKIFVDDFCTYMTVLGADREQMTYYLFEWDYQCNKLLQKKTLSLKHSQNACCSSRKKPAQPTSDVPLLNLDPKNKKFKESMKKINQTEDKRAKSIKGKSQKNANPNTSILGGLKRIVFKTED